MGLRYSALPRSAASAAAAGFAPRLWVVLLRSGSAAGSACLLWFCPAPTGVPGCGGSLFWLGSVRVSWGARSSRLGESLPLDWHRVLRFVIARGGGHGHMRPITRCSGVMGRICLEPKPRIVADVSLR